MKLTISPEIIERYKQLNYTYWHAIAELVDNSTYWFELNRDLIKENDPATTHCEVRIDYDKDNQSLRISDNSVGMDLPTLEAAMVIGKKSDRPGRSVYGMGLKTACIWMGKRFIIKTKKAGLTSAYEVTIDYQKIMAGSLDLDLKELPGLSKSDHYTVVEIQGLDVKLHSRRIGKIKDSLASIYRQDLRNGILTLTWDSAKITWSDANYYKFLKSADGNEYKRDFSFEVDGKTVSGWVGILSEGGKSLGGLTILQNNRVIRGYPDAWKPEGLFGGSGEGATTSLASQRLVGEIHMDGFSVSHTKDNIRWEGDQEQEVTDKLSAQFDDFKKIAAKYRKKDNESPISEVEVEKALASVGEIVNSDALQDAVSRLPIKVNKDTRVIDSMLIQHIKDAVASNQPDAVYKAGDVSVRVYIRDSHPADIYMDYETDPSGNFINITINLLHPYLAADPKPNMEQYILSCVFDAVSEYYCERLAKLHPRTIRDIKNDLMRTSIRIQEDAQ